MTTPGGVGSGSIHRVKKRSSKVPLYEVLHHQGKLSEGPPPVQEDGGRDEEPAVRLGPGNAVRIPVGFVLLAAAAILVLLLGVYMIGYARGERTTRKQYEDMILGSVPVSMSTPDTGHLPQAEVDQAGGTVNAPPGASLVSWQPIEVPAGADPRIPGHYYFVLDTTSNDRAVALANFCRSLQDDPLEAYVFGDKIFVRFVVVLPGFLTRTPSSPDVQSMAIRIEKAWRRWKESGHDGGEVSGAYLRLYRG